MERYTHDDIKIRDIVKLLMDDGVGMPRRSKKKKTLSFKSVLAQEKGNFKTDGEGESDQEDLEGTGRNVGVGYRKLLQEYRESLKELIASDNRLDL